MDFSKVFSAGFIFANIIGVIKLAIADMTAWCQNIYLTLRQRGLPMKISEGIEHFYLCRRQDRCQKGRRVGRDRSETP